MLFEKLERFTILVAVSSIVSISFNPFSGLHLSDLARSTTIGCPEVTTGFGTQTSTSLVALALDGTRAERKDVVLRMGEYLGMLAGE